MAAAGGAAPARRTALITVMGTRGDVQPFVALGLHLQRSRGWRVVLAAPPEFRKFVEGWGLEHEDIGLSLQHAINASPQGKALRTASVFGAFQATSAFFRLPLLESWFASVRRLLLSMRPSVLLLTSFVAMSGAAALPDILGLPTRVVMAHTIPMHATGEFGMPLAGTGFSAPSAFLNRLQWRSLDALVAKTLHLPRAQSIVDAAVAKAALACAAENDGHTGSGSGSGSVHAEVAVAAATDMEAAHALLVSRTRLAHGLAPAPVPTLYIWSPSLLPRPADWPPNCHVVGPLLLRRQPQAPPPPAALEPARPAAVAAVTQPQPAMATYEPAATADAVEVVPALAQVPPLPLVSSRAARSSTAGSGGSDTAALVPRTPQRHSGEPPAGAAALLHDAGSAPPSPPSETGEHSASSVGAMHAADPIPAPAPAVDLPAVPCSPAAALPAAPAAAPACEGDQEVGLPPALQAYLDEAARRSLPVVYVGLGSMLATVFEPPEVDRLVGCMVQAAKLAASEVPLCAVIHAVLPPSTHGGDGGAAGGKGASLGAQAGLGGRLQGIESTGGAYFLLQQPVPHELLLPQVDLCVHHGGAGTTQAVLLAGKPALVVPCVPSSDQPFWAGLVARKGLGPPAWFPVRQLSAERLAAGVLAGLHGLRSYTVAAEALAVEMAQEQEGVEAAAAIVEAAALA